MTSIFGKAAATVDPTLDALFKKVVLQRVAVVTFIPAHSVNVDHRRPLRMW